MSGIDAARILTRSEIKVLSDNCLSNDNRDLYKRIKEMKEEKISFYRAAADNKSIPIDVSEGIIGVLSTDVRICDALIVTDFDNQSSIGAALDAIKEIVKNSPLPSHQTEYIQSLSNNEASMELFYGDIIRELQSLFRC